jgi:flavodoxin
MRAVIVYFSKFGNTRRVAQAMAEVMQQAADVRVISIDQLAPLDFEGVDVVIIGTPTHAFTVPPAVRSVLAALPTGILAGKSVAAFDTTVHPWPLRLMRASPKLLRQLRQLGGKPVATPETFFVKTSSTQQSGAVDLLLEGQIERAQEWAGQILQQFQT